jgi:hypothetical protein
MPPRAGHSQQPRDRVDRAPFPKEDPMRPSMLRTRRVAPALATCILLSLAGCASAPAGEGIEAPQLVVGDSWRYRVTDNLRRGIVSELDAEVIAVSGRAARIRFGRVDAGGRTEWIDEVDGDGGLRSGSLWREPPRPFTPPAQLLAFPLDQGKTWRQVIDTVRGDTELKDQILIYGKVDGRSTMSVPAGGFDAVYVYRIVQLDDADFWRNRTAVRDLVWYAPLAKAPVREEREAAYTEKGGRDPATVRTESTVLELLAFRPGGK